MGLWLSNYFVYTPSSNNSMGMDEMMDGNAICIYDGIINSYLLINLVNGD